MLQTAQVVYTGPESKIMMNAQKGRQKRSNVEDTVNMLLVGILFFEVRTPCTLTHILSVTIGLLASTGTTVSIR